MLPVAYAIPFNKVAHASISNPPQAKIFAGMEVCNAFLYGDVCTISDISSEISICVGNITAQNKNTLPTSIIFTSPNIGNTSHTDPSIKNKIPNATCDLKLSPHFIKQNRSLIFFFIITSSQTFHSMFYYKHIDNHVRNYKYHDHNFQNQIPLSCAIHQITATPIQYRINGA